MRMRKIKYFNVTAVNADGTSNTLNFDRVPESSLESLGTFFGDAGVVLQPAYAYSIDDRPLYVADAVTGEYTKNTGQVI